MIILNYLEIGGYIPVDTCGVKVLTLAGTTFYLLDAFVKLALSLRFIECLLALLHFFAPACIVFDNALIHVLIEASAGTEKEVIGISFTSRSCVCW